MMKLRNRHKAFESVIYFSAKFNAATNKIRMTNMFEWQ